jgi:hypothetical protein
LWGALDDRKAAKVAKHIEKLKFGPTGAAPFIKKIAKGTWEEADILAIALKLEDTEKEVQKAFSTINRNEDWILDNYGDDVSGEVRQAVWDPAFSKEMVRSQLRNLVRLSEERPLPRDDIEYLSREIFRTVEDLNKKLGEIFKEIAPEPKRKKKKSS